MSNRGYLFGIFQNTRPFLLFTTTRGYQNVIFPICKYLKSSGIYSVKKSKIIHNSTRAILLFYCKKEVECTKLQFVPNKMPHFYIFQNMGYFCDFMKLEDTKIELFLKKLGGLVKKIVSGPVEASPNKYSIGNT